MNDTQRDGTRRPLVEDYLGTRARVYGTEQAILVAVVESGDGASVLDELAALADTAGVPTLATVVQKRARPDGATFVGKGKLEEVRAAADEVGADVAIFSDDLTPSQARNLEEGLAIKVIDRTQLILDIFAQRAATKESKLQVELAQLRYLLPRLRGWGQALTRAGAGIGTRGPGETKLEIDREKIRRRIHAIERRLREATGERAVRRKRRETGEVPQVVLVGYTNSGKSTLLTRLAGAETLIEDRLFATLDTLVRRTSVALGREVLLVDSVGFIRDLPHQLIPAFGATLEAVRAADLLLHVVDVARASWSEDYRSVIGTLEEQVFARGSERPPILNVLNKIDAVPPGAVPNLEGVAISAREGIHLETLRERIANLVFPDDREAELLVPYTVSAGWPGLWDGKRVVVVEHGERGTVVRGRFSASELEAATARGAELRLLPASAEE
ncbi:MAG: GTPase HflX [Candidatus Bipolaricaulota bacterium]